MITILDGDRSTDNVKSENFMVAEFRGCQLQILRSRLDKTLIWDIPFENNDFLTKQLGLVNNMANHNQTDMCWSGCLIRQVLNYLSPFSILLPGRIAYPDQLYRERNMSMVYLAEHRKETGTYLIVHSDISNAEQIQSKPDDTRSHTTLAASYHSPLALKNCLGPFFSHRVFELYEHLCRGRSLK